eukprot:TRINITY_DN1223_c0_g1_i3.p1 TRINITY_DN1223_c0_g1~~TRINITY_DN1223_c0_g1_i3.p1  ORF type:complete len:376 (-),score=135.43 TRINITY_DN1223_c0_g1_i3:208-1335(-)
MAGRRAFMFLGLISAASAAALRTTPDKEGALKLRMKMENIGHALQKMTADGGTLSKSKIADDIGIFMSDWQEKMDASKEFENKGDYAKEMTELNSVQAGVKELQAKIVGEQNKLESENVEQAESLLLSVLMQRKDHSIDEQLDIVADPQFKALPIVPMLKEILAKKDAKTPLYVLVGEYLDKHRPQGESIVVKKEQKPAPVLAKNLTPAEKKKQLALGSIIVSLDERLLAMMKRFQARKLFEKQSLEKLQIGVNNHDNPTFAKRFAMIAKAEERKFQKQDAVEIKNIDTMKKAIAAVKAGDVKGLQDAQEQMKNQIDIENKKKTKFLVLLDYLHKSTEADCPYCQAQCVDGCHKQGNPYITCLTNCADAGKAKPK